MRQVERHDGAENDLIPVTIYMPVSSAKALLDHMDGDLDKAEDFISELLEEKIGELTKKNEEP